MIVWDAIIEQYRGGYDNRIIRIAWSIEQWYNDVEPRNATRTKEKTIAIFKIKYKK